MSEQYLGQNIKKLGFGYMRLPLKDGRFDVESVNKMVDVYLENGFSYFDTSFIYEGSEEALNKSIVQRYPRDKFQIATKLAVMMGIRDPKQQMDQFQISLNRLGVDFVDFYLIHGLSAAFIRVADQIDTWSYMREVKEKGLAKHIGFSFHGTPEELDEIFTKHPEMEMVQLQINYLDWENPSVQSRRLYEVTRKHNKPFTVMEPTKGGLLAGSDSKAAELFKSVNPNASAASWAFRYVWGLEGLITALSGMEKMEHLIDNIHTSDNYKPLTAEEHEVIKQAIEIINSVPRVPCTSCRYCVPHCPKNIQIPSVINLFNDYLVHGNAGSTAYQYSMGARGPAPKPSDCVQCGECEKHCPQHIEIPGIIERFANEIESRVKDYRQ